MIHACGLKVKVDNADSKGPKKTNLKRTDTMFYLLQEVHLPRGVVLKILLGSWLC